MQPSPLADLVEASDAAMGGQVDKPADPGCLRCLHGIAPLWSIAPSGTVHNKTTPPASPEFRRTYPAAVERGSSEKEQPAGALRLASLSSKLGLRRHRRTVGGNAAVNEQRVSRAFARHAAGNRDAIERDGRHCGTHAVRKRTAGSPGFFLLISVMGGLRSLERFACSSRVSAEAPLCLSGSVLS